MKSKLRNFPSVNYPSLYECPERRAFMQSQFNKYGITKTNCYLTERFAKLKSNLVIYSHYIPINTGEPEATDIPSQPGINISFLNLIKQWYDKNEEEYAIFCDDDINLSSIDYWSFTWDEFMANLPEDWECIQLIRINDITQHDINLTLHNGFKRHALEIRPREWDDWGTTFMITRGYAKKLIDRHYINEYTYNFDIPCPVWGCLYPISEHFFFRNLGKVYNFPLFQEESEIPSTFRESWIKANQGKLDDIYEHDRIHNTSRKIYLDLWRAVGLSTPIQKMMHTSSPLYGFNSVNTITMSESVKRYEYINSCLDDIGILNRAVHINDRFERIKDNILWYCSDSSICNAGMGVSVSHLASIRYWYDQTTEPYALFTEDDVDLSVAKFWKFRFQDVINRMPNDWEAIQLVRIRNEPDYGGLQLRERQWNDWGCAAFVVKREYAKKILDRNMDGNKYVLALGNYQPIVENIMFLGLGKVYNLPLFAEHIYDSVDSDLWDIERGVKNFHRDSSEYYTNLWKTNTLTLDEIMGIKHD